MSYVQAFDRAALRYRGPKTALNFSTGDKSNTKSGARKTGAKPVRANKTPTESECSDSPSEEERAVEIAGLPRSCKYLPMPHITELTELASNVDLQQSLIGFSGTKRKRGMQSARNRSTYCAYEQAFSLQQGSLTESSCTMQVRANRQASMMGRAPHPSCRLLNWVRTKIAASAASRGTQALCTSCPLLSRSVPLLPLPQEMRPAI